MKIIKGDLFTNEKDSLAHCVSKDLHMGKGIAVQFKKRFGRVQELKSQKPTVGDVVFLKDNDRYIYYLVTKERYYYKPTLATLKNSLINLKKLIEMHNVKSLAIPKIGCGLDKLEWSKVSELIQNIFTDGEITVYTL